MGRCRRKSSNPADSLVLHTIAMTIRLHVVVVVLALVGGCSDKKHDAPATGSAGARPAVVTAEMADTFEAYVVAFEKLTSDIEHETGDCKALLAVVQRDTKDVIAPLAPRGEQLTAAMQAAKGDKSAGEWFGTTFAPRMKAAGEKLRPLETKCGSDAELKAAVGEAMSQFPMMRKKS